MKNKANNEENWQIALAEQYTKGQLPVLKRTDTFRFECVRCGKCCRDREDILLNPFDLFRLCKVKKMTPFEFMKKYCEMYIGQFSYLPLIRIDFRPVYDIGGQEVIGTRCPFLGRSGETFHCRVNDGKPFVCFAYPLGRIQKDYGQIDYLFQDDVSCAGAIKAQKDNIMQNVEEWMCGKETVDREEQYLSIFNRFLQNYHKWINAEKLAKSNILDGKLYQTWLTTIADLLYTNYDYEKDEEVFLKQFELNVEAMETVCKTFVDHFASIIDLRPRIN